MPIASEGLQKLLIQHLILRNLSLTLNDVFIKYIYK